MLPREALWQPATPRLGIPAELVPSHAASIARPDRINPRLQEKRLHRLLSPVETLCCHIHILLTLQGKDPSDSYLSVHIFWACFPERPWHRHKQWCLPVLYLLSCSFALVCHHELKTEAPGQTGTVHSELDRLSLSREEIETDYRITVITITISLPPGNPAKVSDLYRLLSAEDSG